MDKEEASCGFFSALLETAASHIRRCMFSVLSFGPMPVHIAFIMDGNRRYAKRRCTNQNGGHRAGFGSLVSTLRYCYEMGVKYVTVYAFSVDNFKRDPKEVQSLMDLMGEKIEELLKSGSIVSKYGIKINFWGDLDLLTDTVHAAASRAMTATASNTGPVLSICVAYNSTCELLHAIKAACQERKEELLQHFGDLDTTISVSDVERHLFTVDCPDPDIVIRTSGETRLSNFLLWQTAFSHLQNPKVLWPEFSLRHLVWAILEYQRVHGHLEGSKSRHKKLI